jgi:HPt (histidine-containing phosphotransfer) domain-containing protein
LPNTLLKIEQSLQNEDWENVFRSAHYAKSSLSVIKISEMFEWMLQIEMNAKTRTNLSAVPQLFIKVKEQFVLAEQVLAKKFGLEPSSFQQL